MDIRQTPVRARCRIRLLRGRCAGGARMSMLTSRSPRDTGTRARRFSIPLPALAIATLCTAWAEIFWGGVVRLSKSGLGCADNWPLCNGKVYPFWEQPVLIEYIHRLIAALISVLVISLLVVVVRRAAAAIAGCSAPRCSRSRSSSCRRCSARSSSGST